MRATRSVVLAGVLAILVAGGTLTAFIDPSTVSAAVARPHPVRPQVHTLPLAGADQAALAELRQEDAGARPAILTTRRPTEAFRLLGVSWRPDVKAPRIAVEVRTRAAEGWSEWQHLEVEGVVAAPRGALAASDDDAGTRAGTEPVYTGPSSGVQVRVDLISGALPEDLRVDLVDPGASEADSSVVAQPMSTGASAVTQSAIMTRAQWGADESLRNGFAGYGETIKAGFVHHTTGASDYTTAEVPGMIRAIYAYHTQTLGWSDIGYNFLVDRFGRLYEGRWGGMDRPVIGAHTGGFNTNTVGIAALGDHETSPVPGAVMTGFGQLLGWKLGLSGADPYGADPYGRVTLTSGGGDSNRYPAGQAVEFNVISGHRDASFTLCPGQYLYPRLSEIRSEAAAFMGRPGPFRAVTPARVLDTRTGLGAPAGVVTAGSSRSLQVTGAGGVPTSGVGTVVLNVTAVKPSRGGYLTVYPTGRARPTTSNLNYPAGRPAVANLVHVAVGSGGAVTLYAGNADVHVVADVYGWTSNGGASTAAGEGLLQPVAPYRVLDTRSTVALDPGEARSLQVTGTGGAGVPASGGSAVIVNLTVTRPTASSYLTVYPGGQSLPSTSSLNFRAGETRANRAIVPVGPDGTITIYNRAGSSHVVVDVNGWYTGPGSLAGGARFVGLTPSRLEDTRQSPTGPLVNEARSYQVAGATGIPAAGGPDAPIAAVLNVTAVHAAATTGGYFTLYPADIPTRPLASDLNFKGTQIVPNLVVVKLSPDGRFTLSSVAPDATHAVIDVLGYYTR